MKTLFVTLFCFITPIIIAQNDSETLKELFTAHSWKTVNLFAHDSTTSAYTLTPVDTNGRFFDYGNHLVFQEDGKFFSYYTAPCGNDCFTSVNGSYTVKGNKITIEVQHVEYIRECQKLGRFPQSRTHVYTIATTTKGYTLTLNKN